MTEFEKRARQEARFRAVGAYNRALAWIDHPTYDDKTGIVHALDSADAALLLVAYAGEQGIPDIVCGVDRRALGQVRKAVKALKRGERLSLPAFDTVIVGPAFDYTPTVA